MHRHRKCLPATFALICAMPLVQGCVAAAVPGMMAMSAASMGFVGFSGYKVYQTSTEGTVQLAFESEQPGEEIVQKMRGLRRPAVWPTPGSLAAVIFAETLEKTGDFEPISPNVVREFIERRGTKSDLSQLMGSERDREFAAICSALHSDSVVAYSDLGLSTQGKFFTLERMNTTKHVELYYFSCPLGAVVFSEKLAIVSEVGGTTTNEQEIARVAGEVLALRFDDLVHGRTDVEEAAVFLDRRQRTDT